MLAKLGFGVTTLGLCYLAHLLLLVETRTSSGVQLVVVALLGLDLGLGAGWLLRRWRLLPGPWDRTDLALCAVVLVAFSSTWGRQIFMSFFNHDEIGYFGVVNQNWWNTGRWILEPLNEHFQPPLKFCLVVICNLWGIQSYFGLALATFVAAVALCVTLYGFLRRAAGSRLLAFGATGLFATAFDLSDVYQYKGAGFPILVSILFLLLGLLQLLPGESAPSMPSDYDRGRVVRFALCLSMAIFWSSLITVPLFFAAPFLVSWWATASGAESRRLATFRVGLLVAIAVAPTLVFYFCRWKLHISPPRHLHSIEALPLLKMIGSFATQPFGLSASTALPVGVSIFALILLTALGLATWTLFRKQLPARVSAMQPSLMALLFLGLMVPTVSAVQLFAGRGFQLAGSGFHRYEIFPVIGTCCSLVALAGLAGNVFGLRPRATKPVLVAVASAALVVFSVVNHFRMDRKSPWPIEFCRRVNQERTEFFTRLDRVLREVREHNFGAGYARQASFVTLPDLRIELPSLVLLDSYPLEHYARALASPEYDTLLVPFATPGSRHIAMLTNPLRWPETTTFYRLYFPDQIAALTRPPNAGR